MTTADVLVERDDWVALLVAVVAFLSAIVAHFRKR